MESRSHNNSLRNFPVDLLAASGFPFLIVVIFTCWLMSLRGTAWIVTGLAALGIAMLGTVLMGVAKLPRYRQRCFFTFVIHHIPESLRSLYRWGCWLSVVGCMVMLFLWIGSTVWR